MARPITDFAPGTRKTLMAANLTHVEAYRDTVAGKPENDRARARTRFRIGGDEIDVPYATPAVFAHTLEATDHAIGLLRRYGDAGGPRRTGLYQVRPETEPVLRAALAAYVAAHDGECPLPKEVDAPAATAGSILGGIPAYDEAVAGGGGELAERVRDKLRVTFERG